MDVVGKTIASISTGTRYCIITFTDGSEMEVTYFQRGYYGEDCTLEYEYEPPKAAETTESAQAVKDG